jgi:hypothetical protein
LLAYEGLFLLRRHGVYAELRDKWLACLVASVKLFFARRPPPELVGEVDQGQRQIAEQRTVSTHGQERSQ